MTIHLRGRRGKQLHYILEKICFQNFQNCQVIVVFVHHAKVQRFFKVRFCKHHQFYRKKYSEIDIGCYRGSGGD